MTCGSQVKVVLINPSSKWYFNTASPQVISKPDAFKPKKYQIPIEQGFTKYPKGPFELIVSTVTMIDVVTDRCRQNIVTLSGSTTSSTSYYCLVIASGSSPRSLNKGAFIPLKLTVSADEASIESAIRTASVTISAAKTVVIGGAGPIGVEFAGELGGAWAKETGRSITLISSTKHPLPMLKGTAVVEAENLMTKQKV
ncbi:hypothetical protein OIDMADRAFT_46719 [Oidiodendron maius Zn]|uniref:FAD/NAD(P)-binding domain-containing protein n=1 Tax=Oidiodendron maius (strain Zn) TaxID=913774 RepID=A0A0C3HEY1_OIDMZ|nr:hypothetical protein OIDMADRAFT_46719 [Oidiodendron maius Zn]